MRAAFLGAGSCKVVYASNVGVTVEVEPMNRTTRSITSFENELFLQEYKPTGIAPIGNVTPNSTIKMWNRWNGRTTECRVCMQMSLSFAPKPFLDHVINSDLPTEKQKVETCGCLFGALYVNLVFQALRNLKKSVPPVDWGLNNIATF